MIENSALALDVLHALLTRAKFSYAMLSEDLCFREFALNFQDFLDNPEVQPGQPAIEIFDALIGSEQILLDTLKEKDSEYRLEYIYFSTPNFPSRYLSLFMWPYYKKTERYFLLVIEDVTSAALVKQRTIQARNDLYLLHIRLDQSHTKLQRQALYDSVTELPNRRYLDDSLPRYIELANRYQTSLSLAMVDIDNFKALNDTFGHQAGDEGLQALANIISESKRAADFVARYGGEEFCIILPMIDVSQARAFAERVQKRLAKSLKSSPQRFTISVGIAALLFNETDAAGLIKLSDEALYRAKREGKNCIRIAREY